MRLLYWTVHYRINWLKDDLSYFHKYALSWPRYQCHNASLRVHSSRYRENLPTLATRRSSKKCKQILLAMPLEHWLLLVFLAFVSMRTFYVISVAEYRGIWNGYWKIHTFTFFSRQRRTGKNRKKMSLCFNFYVHFKCKIKKNCGTTPFCDFKQYRLRNWQLYAIFGKRITNLMLNLALCIQSVSYTLLLK